MASKARVNASTFQRSVIELDNRAVGPVAPADDDSVAACDATDDATSRTSRTSLEQLTVIVMMATDRQATDSCRVLSTIYGFLSYACSCARDTHRKSSITRWHSQLRR